jgi:DNA primase
MARYFHRQLLYRLRNQIPLERLIAEHLDWPHKQRDGRFCFLCPRCSEFLTAVNPRTNLGRCFHCERNFNTIDFVMLATEREFVDAVHFLSDFLPPDGTSPSSSASSVPPSSPPSSASASQVG